MARRKRQPKQKTFTTAEALVWMKENPGEVLAPSIHEVNGEYIGFIRYSSEEGEFQSENSEDLDCVDVDWADGIYWNEITNSNDLTWHPLDAVKPLDECTAAEILDRKDFGCQKENVRALVEAILRECKPKRRKAKRSK